MPINSSRSMKRTLKHLGVNDVNSGIVLMARLITDHKKLEMVLAGEEPQMRQAVYDALRPHLSFVPKPLDVYGADAAQRAERERLPIAGENGVVRDFSPATDLASVESLLTAIIAKRTLTLVCGKCLFEQKYHAMEHETPTAVVRRARQAGWVYDYKAAPVVEICPGCANKP